MSRERYLQLNDAKKYLNENHLENIQNEYIKFRENIWNDIGKSRGRVVIKGFIVNILDKNNLLNDFINKYWLNGKTEDGEIIIKRYKNKYHSYINVTEVELPEDDDSEFANESDLRDYLVKNLSAIENGLTLYKDNNGKEGVEYPVDENNKRIDILAIDKNNIPVVIELKVKRGYEKVIGQCQYYKNKLKSIFNTNEVRVIIIAKEITDYLKMGIMDMKGYELFEYKLKFELESIKV